LKAISRCRLARAATKQEQLKENAAGVTGGSAQRWADLNPNCCAADLGGLGNRSCPLSHSGVDRTNQSHCDEPDCDDSAKNRIRFQPTVYIRLVLRWALVKLAVYHGTNVSTIRYYQLDMIRVGPKMEGEMFKFV
jgi:hypothetical protein